MNYRYTVRSHETACFIMDNYTGERIYVRPLKERSELVAMCRRMNGLS